MKSRADILQKLAESKTLQQEKYPISKLGLFGSYARNEANENSDIDLLVEFNAPVGIEFIQMSLDLEQIFNHKVDLVSDKALKPRMRPCIEKDILYV